MHLCKVSDMSRSSVVGREVAKQFNEKEAMSQCSNTLDFKEQCKDPDAHRLPPRFVQHDGYLCSICGSSDGDWLLQADPCLPADFGASFD